MSAVRPRPARDVRLDVVRGALQLSIFAKHFALSLAGGWLIHSNWGFSDSSEQFLFLSGLTLGSVFAYRQGREGFAAATRDMVARAWRLYRVHMLVFALFAGLILMACATVLPGESERLGWADFLHHPFRHLPGVVLMLHQPAFMGILPSFVWGMLLLPGFVGLTGRVGDWAILLPLALWALVQATGLSVPSLHPHAGLEFNPLAWQVLFLGGAWLGRRALLWGEALALPPGWARLFTTAAVAIVALALVVKLALLGGWLGLWAQPFAEPRWLSHKEDLPVLPLLHALALAWLVARFVPREARWMHSRLGAWVATIGRHSLEVFALGLFLAWAAGHLLMLAGGGVVADLALTASGVAVLGGWAVWLDQAKQGSGSFLNKRTKTLLPL